MSAQEGLHEALSKAIDLINTNEEFHANFKKARSISDEEFGRSLRRHMVEYELIFHASRTKPNPSLGYWYGRYTDPRWNKSVKVT